MYTKILVICIISLVAFSRSDDEITISSECRKQFIKQTCLRDECHNRLTTPREFYHEFNTTVIDFSGTNEDLLAVEEFFTKYCDIVPHFLQCFDISDDVSTECRTQIPNREVKSVVFQVLSSLAHYACENNGTVLKKILPHDGFRFFFLNDDFDQCVAIANDFQSFNDLCSALDRSLPCIIKTIGDHPNKDIVVITQESMNRFKSAANC